MNAKNSPLQRGLVPFTFHHTSFFKNLPFRRRVDWSAEELSSEMTIPASTIGIPGRPFGITVTGQGPAQKARGDYSVGPGSGSKMRF